MILNRRHLLKGAGALAVAALIPLPVHQTNAAAGQGRTIELTAQTIDLSIGGGRSFKAWSFNRQMPGPLIQAQLGETIRVLFKNRLPEPSTIHWHGLPVPNPMDGVPGLTQKAVPPGGDFLYEFPAKPAGTYIYHSHQGLQLDRGLYGALVVDDPNESREYDQEFLLVLEDWVTADGGGPNAVRRKPGGMMMGGRGMMRGRGRMGRMMGGVRGGPPAEPVYDAYAVNGKAYPHTDPLRVKKGQRIRLRICNASASTIYDLRLAGHTMSITHADGQAIRPVAADVLRIGMGERYDVLIKADNPGHWLLGAFENGWGEGGLKLPVIYEGFEDQIPKGPDFPSGLRYPGYWDFEAARPSSLGIQQAGQRYPQALSGGMHSPFWTINGYRHPQSETLAAKLGQVVALSYSNHSHMPHPMHLHGHFFRVVNPNLPPERWIFKDTIIVDPMRRVEVQFLADNPGGWLHHCHHLYHMEAGMANRLKVAG
jgi:FtsP/CotA-like multicopper oxidase with cupredoxin domain